MTDIPITTRRGVQAVALVFAGALGVSAYLFATTGWGTPFPGCWPPLPRPLALSVSAVQATLAVGFGVAAVRNPAGPAVHDRLLVGLVLSLFAAVALTGAAYTFATGVARFGKSGCLDVGAPLSYGAGAIAIVVGAIALTAAATVVAGRRDSD